MRVIGLMSGTSMDGVDVALIETDGERSVQLGPQAIYPYALPDQMLLRGAIEDAVGLDDRAARPGRLHAAEAMVTERHAEAVERFMAANAIARDTIDLVGFHGQTVLHRPRDRLTVQIGDGQALASRLGVPVASDFRADDVAGGGEGAPLVPVYHRALVEQAGIEGSVAVVNIGGVANVTTIVVGRDPVACDTGPGNALLDDLMLARTGRSIDEDGATAAQGRIDDVALAHLLDHDYFAKPAPKSLDRNAFSIEPVKDLGTEDAAATLTAFTAETVAGALAQMGAPGLAIICGGGARNATLMAMLRQRLPCPVETAEARGWSIDGMEAQAFAYLAARRARDLPITFPKTTGIDRPISGGRINAPSHPWRQG